MTLQPLLTVQYVPKFSFCVMRILTVGGAIVHLLTIWNSTLAVMVQASPLPPMVFGTLAEGCQAILRDD
jgi:hypothetical protein